MLEVIAHRVLNAGQQIAEPVMNERLARIWHDPVMLRGTLIDHGMLDRAPDGSRYELSQTDVHR